MAAGAQQRRTIWQAPRAVWAQRLFCALRVAPWLVFGPITGFFSERAVACFRQREPILGVLYIVINIAILLAIPLLTAKLVSRL